MTEKQYPDYIHRMTDEAERLLTDEYDPDLCEAAGVCFDILALFPEHEGAPPIIHMRRELLGSADEELSDSPVDWSYLDAIERREIDASKFPRWAREFLDDIDDPKQHKATEEMSLEQFSNKSLYGDEYLKKRKM
jgi:hypothetical protein